MLAESLKELLSRYRLGEGPGELSAVEGIQFVGCSRSIRFEVVVEFWDVYDAPGVLDFIEQEIMDLASCLERLSSRLL
jgi:hypothetical protein